MSSFRLLLLYILFLSPATLFAQSGMPACRTRISVITCSPGTELYALFGHTALRIIDSATASDIVFNYGTFDFGDPDFYVKFIRGKLLYRLAAEPYESFLGIYRWEQRHVWEQQIPLTCSQKQQLTKAIYENLKPENRYYKYDFFYDNCTTRIRDLLAVYAGTQPSMARLIPPGTSYRNLIHNFLNEGRQPWSKLGIDLLLGAPTDLKSNQQGAQFLPIYFMEALSQPGSGPAGGISAVPIFIANPPVRTGWMYLPPALTSALSLLVGMLLWKGRGRWQRFGISAYRFLVFFMGLLGCLLLFMWFGTDHQTCKWNYNLLWAVPSHLVMAFFLNKKYPLPVKGYLMFMAIFPLIVLALYFFLEQDLNLAFAPLLVLTSVGAVWHLKYHDYA